MTSGLLSERIGSFDEMLAAWQIYNDEYVAIRSGLQDKEREVNSIVLQQDTAESPKQHVDKAKVRAVFILNILSLQ